MSNALQPQTERSQRFNQPLIYTQGMTCRTTAPLMSHDNPDIGTICEVIHAMPMAGWHDMGVPEYRVELVGMRGIRAIRTHRQLERVPPGHRF